MLYLEHGFFALFVAAVLNASIQSKFFHTSDLVENYFLDYSEFQLIVKKWNFKDFFLFCFYLQWDWKAALVKKWFLRMFDQKFLPAHLSSKSIIHRLLFLISTIGFVVILCVCLWWGLLLWIYFGMCNLCLLERNKSVKSEISSCTYNMGNYFLPSMGVGCQFIIWNSSLGFIKDLLCILRICHDMQNFKTF